jgi:putative transposase
MPRLGGRKLLHCLGERAPALLAGIGRDAFFDLLREADLLVVRKRQYRVKTTESRHSFRRYADLYNEHRSRFVQPFMAVVADITYIATLEGFAYAALLTDRASRKVLGFDVSASLCIEGSLRAARMLLKEHQRCRKTSPQALPATMLHHSDRGVQYCSTEYVRLLQDNAWTLSMTQSGEPTDNALAERVNGIFKDEFLFDHTFQSIAQAQKSFAEAVQIYNNERPHSSLNMLTPNAFFNNFFAP